MLVTSIRDWEAAGVKNAGQRLVEENNFLVVNRPGYEYVRVFGFVVCYSHRHPLSFMPWSFDLTLRTRVLVLVLVLVLVRVASGGPESCTPTLGGSNRYVTCLDSAFMDVKPCTLHRESSRVVVAAEMSLQNANAQTPMPKCQYPIANAQMPMPKCQCPNANAQMPKPMPK